MAHLSIRILAVAMTISLPASEASVTAVSLSQLVSRPYLELSGSCTHGLLSRVTGIRGPSERACPTAGRRDGTAQEGRRRIWMLAWERLRDQLKSLNKEASSDDAKMVERSKNGPLRNPAAGKGPGREARGTRARHAGGIRQQTGQSGSDRSSGRQRRVESTTSSPVAEPASAVLATSRISASGRSAPIRKKTSSWAKKPLRDMKLYSLMPPELEQKEATRVRAQRGRADRRGIPI